MSTESGIGMRLRSPSSGVQTFGAGGKGGGDDRQAARRSRTDANTDR
jgi:hypothetical protein